MSKSKSAAHYLMASVTVPFAWARTAAKLRRRFRRKPVSQTVLLERCMKQVRSGSISREPRGFSQLTPVNRARVAATARAVRRLQREQKP